MGTIATDPNKFRVERIRVPCARPKCPNILFLIPSRAKLRKYCTKSCATIHKLETDPDWIAGSQKGREKAHAKNRKTREEIYAMPAKELYAYAFKRGYSAAERKWKKWRAECQ